jgi:hypothetical protein
LIKDREKKVSNRSKKAEKEKSIYPQRGKEENKRHQKEKK